MINEIILRRKNRLTIDAEQSADKASDSELVMRHRYITSICKNVESYGYAFGTDVIEVLSHKDTAWFLNFYQELIPMLDRLCGGDVEYHPMYVNFPQQVADADDAELFINAVVHYCTDGILMPKYEENARLPLLDVKDSSKVTVLHLADRSELGNIFSNILYSKTSISEQDAEDVWQIIKTYPDFKDYLPDVIPLKENVALVAKYLLSFYGGNDCECIAKYFKTATDVLRFIVSLSDGDISLAERTEFKHLSRPERRMVMNLLTGCGSHTEDMFRYRDAWIRIGEILHPNTYLDRKYENVVKAFKTLRNDKKPLYLMGKVESEIATGNALAAAELLSSRPGEFARRMDKLLRSARDEAEQSSIIETFAKVADNVATPVLLQLRQAFIGRLKGDPKVRVFFPKGKTAKAFSIPYNLPKIDNELCIRMVGICDDALLKAYGEREALSSVYVDDELKNYIVPFSQRSASSGNKILVRGSRVSVASNTSTIRSFIWWTNTRDSHRVDLDLSSMILDEDFRYLTHISYTNLRDSSIRGYHSGDIVNGGSPDGKGVAEFIDVDIDSVVERGGRYICFQVYSFTGQNFSSLPNCRFGWMERQDVNTGEIFEPSTVDMAIRVQSDSKYVIPVLFDCVERQYIWMDLAGSASGFYNNKPNNVETNMNGVRAAAYSIANINKPNMYDLVRMNALARGTIVNDRNKADIIFSNDTTKPTVTEIVDGVAQTKERDVPIVTAFDVDYYMGQLI